MRRTWRITAVYSFAHFAVDFGCAFAMFSACKSSPVCFLLYNFFAFAMQMPLGLLADMFGCNRLFAVCGVLITAGICLLPQFGFLAACVLGLGNGFFHVGGGLDVMHLAGKKSAPLGVFVSPGAYGIYFGTLLGQSRTALVPVVGVLLLACAAIAVMCRKVLPSSPVPAALPDRRILPCAALLFVVVILRSYGGMAASFEWKTGLWSFAAVTAVVLGKALGGVLADRFGLFSSALCSLLLSAALFCFSGYAVPGVLALLLFNMTMPMTLFALSTVMPGVKGFSFGLLTFALFLGYLPTYLGAETISGAVMAILALLSALFLLPGIRMSGKEMP